MTTTSAASNNPYLECVDDGLFMGQAGPWAMRKLTILSNYLKMVTTAMRSPMQKWRALHYIDLFSGSGKNRIRESGKIILGSPLLAVSQVHPFDTCYFVDLNPIALDALRRRCATTTNKTRIKYFPEDGNKAVLRIAAEIKGIDQQYIMGKGWSFNVAFIDPYALQLEWDTIKTLAKMSIMDLIIYYPLLALNRNMKNCYNTRRPNKIDAYFGGLEWRVVYRDFLEGKIPRVHRALLDLYWEKLDDLGYVENKQTEQFIKNAKKNATLYGLIHAGKNPLACKFWDQATKTDDLGQPRLF